MFEKIWLANVWLGVGVAALTLTPAGVSANATTADPSRAFATTSVRGPRATVRRTQLGRRTNADTPTKCTSNYPSYSFTGMPASEGDVAGGINTAVLGGGSNLACDLNSAIGAGVTNVIGYNDNAVDSFIGAGQDNGITGSDAFVGAGYVNIAEGTGSFIGAGGSEYYNSQSLGYPPPSNINDGIDAFIGAGDLNSISSSGNGSFIGGGGYQYAESKASSPGNQISGIDSFIGAGDQNTVAGGENFVGAGQLNTIEANTEDAVIAGGYNNVVSEGYSFDGAGLSNNNAGAESFIGAGYLNTVATNANQSFVGGGTQNTMGATLAVLGGGSSNSIASAAEYSVTGGGYGNTQSGAFATLNGGEFNQTGGSFATVPGGSRNEALGTLTFAAGYQAHATHGGSFVWSDYVSGASPLADSAVNQFLVRASGGTYVYSSENLASGVKLAAGSGTWASLSDRNAKTDVAPLDDASILAKVAALPVSTWRYKTESGVRHVGPMAQDFYAAFGVGEDNRHITSIDEDGVALSAIKALHAELERKDGTFAAELKRKDAQIAALRAETRKLDAAVAKLLARR